MDRKRPGGAEKARLKKRKALIEDAAKCAKLTDIFSRRQTEKANDKSHTLEGPSGPVKVKEGSDVILPCKLQPPQDVSKKVVQWKRDSEIVHTRKKGMDDLDSQNSNFKNRTKLFPEEMNKGNISLKIFNVTKEDAGNYSCSVSMPNTKRTYIQLVVEIPQTPGGNETNKQGPGRLSDGAISGIVIGALVLFVIITAGCWRFWKWWKARRQTQEMIQYQRNGDYVEVLQGPSGGKTCTNRKHK